MNFESLFKLLLNNFYKAKVDFALIGGFAVHVSGYTRATEDIDFLIAKEDALMVKRIMLSYGYELLHESEDVSNYLGKLGDLGKVDFLYAQRKYAKAMLLRGQEKFRFSKKNLCARPAFIRRVYRISHEFTENISAFF